MQRYKTLFKDPTYKGTITNSQSCLRLNDLDNLSTSPIHFLSFDMLGLFSFNEMTVKQSIDFWMEFLNTLGIKPDYVTIHPDKVDWLEFYNEYNIEVRIDSECTWSDGGIDSIMSYCTEFYKNDIEIGNIVNPYGTCIDAGFGSDRIQFLLDGIQKTREEKLRESIFKIISSGYTPTYNKQGSILRKLLRICYLETIIIDHQFYQNEITRQEKIIEKYNRLKDKHKDKSKEWWYSSFGIDIDLISGAI